MRGTGKMKITSLAENCVYQSPLIGEHGLSLLVENAEHRVMVDTGQGLALRHNMEILGIEPDSIETLFISHGHYDHTGGLSSLLDARKNELEIVIHPAAFKKRYSISPDGDLKSIGIASRAKDYEAKGAHFTMTESGAGIQGVDVVPGILDKYQSPLFDRRLVELYGNESKPDSFEDELSFVFHTAKGAVIITGCAHKGIIEILQSCVEALKLERVHAIVGGAHLRHAPGEYIIKSADCFESYDIGHICLSHCTGFEAAAYFQERFKERFSYLWCGRTIEL